MPIRCVLEWKIRRAFDPKTALSAGMPAGVSKTFFGEASEHPPDGRPALVRGGAESDGATKGAGIAVLPGIGRGHSEDRSIADGREALAGGGLSTDVASSVRTLRSCGA